MIVLLLLTLLASCRKSDYNLDGSFEVIRDLGFGTGTRTLKSDVPYLIEGLVFVNEGQELTIEPGTIVRFKSGQADKASALIVSRGGKIFAEGTSEKPIIFTAQADDLNGSVPLYAQGLWGGLIVLGHARINHPDGEAIIEGIPMSEPRAVFGGDYDDDNSGTIKYISIRHGGTNIGQGNEINGLTLGGVGSKTKIEFVEVISNKDDGVEIFGGTVNLRNILVSFCGDDAFDFDMGYRGKGQFWCAIQSQAGGDKLIEADGNSIEKHSLGFYTEAVLYNLSFVGKRDNSGDQLISFNTQAAASIHNSIMVNQDNGVLLEFSAFRQNSYTLWLDGKLNLTNNLFFNVNDDTPDGIFKVHGINGENTTDQESNFVNYFTNAANHISNPGFVKGQQGFWLNPVNSLAFEGFHQTDDTWFIQVPYKGAFYMENWADWTLLGQKGLLIID